MFSFLFEYHLQNKSTEQDTYHQTLSIHPTSMQEQGWGILRTRLYATLFNQETLVWVGPPDLDMREHFLSIFGKHTMLEGDSFIAGPDDCVRSHLATLRRLPPTEKRTASLLSPSQTAALAKANEVHAAGVKTGIGGAMIADLSVSPSRVRNRCGPWIPTLSCSSVLYSVTSDHFFTPDEMDFAMGWPTTSFPANEKARRSIQNHLDILQTKSHNTRRILTGNSMHCAQLTAWNLYILSHCVRRDAIECYRPPLRYKRPRDDVPAEEEKK